MDAFIAYTIAGIATGAIYAISASGLVVTYTTSGVFNFAHGATGMLMAFLYWQLRVGWHMAAPAALVLVLFLAAPLYGVALERVLIRRLRPGDTGVTLTVTLGILVLSLGIGYTVWTVQVNRVLEPFFGPFYNVGILGTRISWEELITIGVAVVVAVALRLFLFETRIGVAMRGVVDDRPLIALNGWPPARLNALSWAIGAGLGALAGILQGSEVAGGLQVLSLTFLVVNAYAAAVLGRLRSLPLTFVGAMALGLLVQYFTGYVTLTGWISNIKPALPTVFLFAVLLVLRPARLRAGAATVTETLRVPSLRRSLVVGAAFVGAAAIISAELHGTLVVQAGEGLAVAVVGLSVVLLTGYGGQVSLAPYAFMGFGAWLFAEIAPGGGLLGLLGVFLVAAVLGGIVALPALRLVDLYLALWTLAFAELAYLLFFNQVSIMGTDLPVPRVHLPLVSLAGGSAYLFFECVLFALLALGLLVVRRGRTGRLLLATRDSSAGCATLGANLTMVRLVVFGAASGIAAVGGALYGASERYVTATNFLYEEGLIIVLIMFIWGVASVSGALFAGIVLQVVNPQVAQRLPSRWSEVVDLAVGLGAISLGRNPNGVAGQVSAVWGRTLSGLRRRRGPWPDPGTAGPQQWTDRFIPVDDQIVSTKQLGRAAP